MQDVKNSWITNGTKLIKYTGEEKEIIIPEYITEIGNNAFWNKNKIIKVTVPHNVTSIGYGAFNGCTALEEIKLEKVEVINSYAFTGCTSLKKVEFGNSKLRCVNVCTFKGCSSLREITLPKGVKKIATGAFCKCYTLERVYLPETISIIRKYAFSKCRNICKIILLSEKTHFDNDAFYKCNPKLRFIWDSKLSFSKEAVKGFDIDYDGVLKCYFGTEREIVIPETVKKIGKYAFYHRKVESVTALSVSEIEASAFWACTNMKKITFSDKLVKVGEDSFGQCRALESLAFSNKNIHFEGRIAPMAYSLKKVELPQGLKKIPDSAFYYCKSLEECNIPEGTEYIGDGAFQGCRALKDIYIPQSVKELDWNIFNGCHSLTEVILRGKDTVIHGRTDTFCTASYRYCGEPKTKTAVIFMGLQASGKSYYYNLHFKGKYEHINLDTLHTRNKESLMLKECIKRGADIVIDNTNPTKADRARYIPLLKEAGYRIIGYFFESKIKDCIRRNEERIGKACVPNTAIAATSNKLEMPSYNEGFEELYFIERSGETVMIKRDWRE